MLAFILLPGLVESCTQRGQDTDAETREIRSLIRKASNIPAQQERIAQIRFLDSALSGKSLSVSEQMLVYEYKAGIYTNQLQDYARANAITDSMILLAEANDPEEHRGDYVKANFAKGDVLFNEGKYNEAYTHYYKARRAGNSTYDSCTLGEYSFRLALILYRQKRFVEAAENFRHSFSETGQCNFDFDRYYRLQQVLNNIGLSYYKAGDTLAALEYYQRGLDYIAKHRTQFPDRQYLNDIAEAVILGNMAEVVKLNGDTSVAKQMLKQSITINTRPGYDNMDAQYSQLKLAEIYSEEGFLDSMRMVLADLRKGLDTISNRRAEMDWNRLMWRYNNQVENARNAYIHLLRFTAMRDSTEHESDKLKSTDLSQQIRMLENEFEIQSLQKDNELKNVYLWIFILASVLAAVILFFIFRSLSRSRKNVKQLTALNTEVNEQKQQVQQALTALEQKNRQQERILRAVAHDLRSPVATISMLCDLVLNEENPVTRAEMIGFIKTSCNNSLDLVAEILEVADLSRKKEQEKKPSDITQLIKDAVAVMQLKASEKDQLIKTSLPEKSGPVQLNPEKMQRVLTNLITNAIKFSPKGAEIRVKFDHIKGRNRISVEDDGIGIPTAFRDKVFDMFTEAKRKGTAGELPYGLGLSICKQIVDAHNGRIWFDSIEQKGTIFYVELP